MWISASPAQQLHLRCQIDRLLKPASWSCGADAGSATGDRSSLLVCCTTQSARHHNAVRQSNKRCRKRSKRDDKMEENRSQRKRRCCEFDRFNCILCCCSALPNSSLGRRLFPSRHGTVAATAVPLLMVWLMRRRRYAVTRASLHVDTSITNHSACI